VTGRSISDYKILENVGQVGMGIMHKARDMKIMRELATACLVLTLALTTCHSSAPDSQRPNILYIMTDDHAPQMMSAYDSTRASTPNLDRIAREGMMFRNSFVTNSLCAPSRAVLLTGKYSHKNGQLGNRETFDGSQPTFPKMLQAAGYQTAIVGKWHLKSEPTGFDYWNVLPGQGRYLDPVLIETGEEKTHRGYVTDVITDLALSWLRNRDPDRPFALLYHHKAPHAEWVPNPKHESLFENEMIARPPTFDDDYAGRADPIKMATNRLVPDLLSRWRRWGPELAKEDPGDLEGEQLREWMYQQYVKDYLRVMKSVDDNVGRVLDFLDEQGLAENTLVIYTSDNGKFVGDHFMFDKRLMYEGPLRIPLVVRYPPAIAPGSKTETYSLNVDYAPTLLDYAGLDIPVDMQGRSLRPILEGAVPTDWRQSIYYQYWEPPGGHNVERHYGIRTNRHKLIYYHGSDYGGEPAWELIDLQADPNEYTNLYDNPEYAETVATLKGELERLRAELDVEE